MKAEYLILDLIILACPFIVHFIRPKYKLIPLRELAVPILLPTFLYCIWDFFVVNYFWIFNPKYNLGLLLLNVPVEEMFFFLVVSYSYLFLFRHFPYGSKKPVLQLRSLYPIIILILAIIGRTAVIHHLTYTAMVLGVLCIILFIDFLWQSHLFITPRFLIFLIFIFLLTTVFNLYLTARPIVIYNEALKTNLNLWTIPLEDYILGLSLISLNCILFTKLNNRDKHND